MKKTDANGCRTIPVNCRLWCKIAMLDRYFYQFTKAKDVAEIVPTCQ